MVVVVLLKIQFCIQDLILLRTDEVSLLQQVLMSNFKLNTKLYEKTPGQWVINIPLTQEIPLKDIVLPYIHVSMLYKV